ncbi:hypothetical protein DCAR_0624580 [Daucus carota subsp. sativus]|uniref:Reverse transcriptase domain-containing protein n=1 Tax=Daucus carota subsp. sativus TaxID=79200 RepID=A0AAF1B6N2_DAUCS|nr:hypothetical protein DCAR_0624580 [Daucus carota subsp. sativus]
MTGILKALNIEKTTTRDGEVYVNKSPILQSPLVNHFRQKGDDKENQGRMTFSHPKVELTHFKGEEDPRVWLRKCNKFFLFHQVKDSFKCDLVEMYLDGKADTWFQSYKFVKETVSWKEFGEAIVKRFGKKGGVDEQEEFNKLVQEGSVMEYIDRFEELKAVLLCRNANLDESYFVSSFISGLKGELKPMVRLMKPTSLSDAIDIAQLQEQTVDLIVKKHGSKEKWGNTKKPETNQQEVKNLSNGGDKKPISTTSMFKKISPEEFQYRKNNHLCYKCGEKYGQGHQCKNSQYTFMLFDEAKDEDILSACEEVDEDEREGAVTEVSLNSLSSQMARKTITLEGKLKEKTITILVDTGSTLTYLNVEVVKQLGLEVTKGEPIQVRLADGRMVVSSEWVPKVKWKIQDYSFCFDMRVLDIGGWDMIVGVDWMEQYSPLLFDFKKLYLKLNAEGNKDEQMTLQGTVKNASISLIRGHKLKKYNQGLVANQIKQEVSATIEGTGQQQADEAEVPEEIRVLLNKFPEVFSIPTTLPPIRNVDHEIPLQQDAQPFKLKPYRYPHSQKTEIENQVQEMLRSGIIKPSNSPFASPVILVRKKDNSWRFCVDYRHLNKITIKDKFPIPNIDELLDELHGAKLFSKLDLRAGYHQILVKAVDTPKTAFQTHHGHFEFVVMPFGLTNAPATFQALMNQVFQPYMRKFVLVFFDDILIYSPDLSKHVEHLELVLKKLQDNQLYVKKSKCSFAATSVEYLGHMISADGVSMDHSKVESIRNWPVPGNVKELRGFLGLSGYYRRFIKNYGIIARPLTNLLRKDGFVWNEETSKAFSKLKEALCTKPVLAMPDFQKPFVLETDACDSGMGAVLMQNGNPISYLSKSFNSKNKGFSVYEKELLALVMAVTRWRHYLVGNHFIIRTDHQALKYLLEQQLHTSLQYKWLSKLLGMDYEIQYKKGVENTAADSLSRIKEWEGNVEMLTAVTHVQPRWIQQLKDSYEEDDDIKMTIGKVLLQDDSVSEYQYEQGILKKGNKLCVGNKGGVRQNLIDSLHQTALGGALRPKCLFTEA